MEKPAVKEKQMSDSFRVGALLAGVGGFLDAFTFLAHGGVFANAQTGNIVLLGICLARGDWHGVFRYLLPITAFFVGIGLAEMVRQNFRYARGIHWRQCVLLAEVAILLGCACAEVESANTAVTVAISFLCALQMQSFRKVHGYALTTTMCTGNLRSAIEGFVAWWRNGKGEGFQRARHTAGVVLFFLLGASCGVFALKLTNGHEGTALFIPVVLLLLAFSLLFRPPTPHA